MHRHHKPDDDKHTDADRNRRLFAVVGIACFGRRGCVAAPPVELVRSMRSRPSRSASQRPMGRDTNLVRAKASSRGHRHRDCQVPGALVHIDLSIDVRPEQCRRPWPESAAAAVVCQVSGLVHVPDGWTSARCGRARVLKPLGGPVLQHRLAAQHGRPLGDSQRGGGHRVLHPVICAKAAPDLLRSAWALRLPRARSSIRIAVLARFSRA